MIANDDDDLPHLIEDDACEGGDTPAPSTHTGPAWRILIVDDEEDVHHSTLFALKGLKVLDHDLTFIHAYSAAQARGIILADPDIALILLDVVMETASSGLDLVGYIREDLKRDAVRIILRTGQPGYAPEVETIRRLDINDYKTKGELTRIRLYTSLTVGLRSYQQIQNLNRGRAGLQLIVAGSAELSKLRGLQIFCEGVVTQLSALLNVETEGLVCAQRGATADDGFQVIAAAGRYAGMMNKVLADLPDPQARYSLQRCLVEKTSQLDEQCCLYFGGGGPRAMAAYIATSRALTSMETRLVEVFCTSISVGMENVLLYGQLLDHAYVDQLLRIPNRLRFTELVTQKLQASPNSTLALLDIDDFAGINSTMGNPVGDALLQVVAQRLTAQFGVSCAVARVAGDTFGILGPEGEVNPENLLSAFQTPFHLNGHALSISASLGLMRLGPDATNAEDALKNCHLALKLSKSKKRGGATYYSAEIGTLAKERVRLLYALKDAFAEQRIFVVYQPQVRMADRRPLGAEALIRWRLDDGTFVPPNQFIPLAEHSGLIVPLGKFVLRTALHQLKRLHDMGHTLFRMSVNVARQQLIEPNFLPVLQAAIGDANVNPAQVEIEITESSAMDDVAHMTAVLAAVRATGVPVAIDDFGTGYSSLAALHQLGVQKLKVDKAFVDHLGEGDDDEVIAQTVIDLAKNLHMDVIAEGVETAQQQERLLAMGCPQGQGYLYGRPMVASQLEVWLGAASL